MSRGGGAWLVLSGRSRDPFQAFKSVKGLVEVWGHRDALFQVTENEAVRENGETIVWGRVIAGLRSKSFAVE